ncbi:MAG: RluA family pseudouridine synthase [Oscillospiraceae bacterium]
MRKFNFFVTNDFNGKTTEEFLKQRVGLSSRVIRKIKSEENNLLKNGSKVRTVDLINKNDIITFFLNEKAEISPLFNSKVKFLYIDEDVIVADKPSNMPTHRAKYYQNETLENAYAGFLIERKEDITSFKAVYRLDKNTSGLVLIARHSFAADYISKNITKQYFAVCHGIFQEKTGLINAPIEREYEKSHKRVVREDGKSAITQYQVLQEKENYSLVKFNLMTGRTHQIRVHINYIGHPLLGDEIYGNEKAKQFINRQALHCGICTFVHPVLKKEISIVSQLPMDFKALGFNYKLY